MSSAPCAARRAASIRDSVGGRRRATGGRRQAAGGSVSEHAAAALAGARAGGPPERTVVAAMFRRTKSACTVRPPLSYSNASVGGFVRTPHEVILTAIARRNRGARRYRGCAARRGSSAAARSKRRRSSGNVCILSCPLLWPFFFLSPSCRSCESVFFPVFLPASISRLFPPRAPIVLPGSSPAGFQHPPRSTRSAALRSHGPPRRGTAPNPPVLRGSTVVAVRPSRHVQVAIMGAPPPRAIGRETRRPHSPASLRLRETCSQPLRTKHPCTTCCLSAPAAASPLRRRGAGRDCGAKEGHPRLERARSARAPTTPLRAPPASLIPVSGPARFANCNAHSLGRADTRNTPRAPRWWPRGLSHREGGQHQRSNPRAGTPPAGRSRGSEDARGQRAHDERSLQGHAAEL